MNHSSSDKRPNSGFTLIELLMVAFLIPLVAFAAYANFSSGVRIWQRLHQETNLEDLNIFSQKNLKSFEGTIKYSPINFEGDKTSVAFPALIETEGKLGGDRAIGKMRLYYDLSEKTIKRQQKNISQVYREASIRSETLLSGVSSFQIGYYAMDKQDKTFQWFEAWEDRPNEFPIAVRFEFEWSSHSGTRPVKKIYIIPTGG